MDADLVLARIADNPRLPTPPMLTLRILERASQPNCTLSEIGKLISQDAALCGKMLRLVNSSLFGLHRPVTSIARALNLLGLNHVRSLVLSLSLPALRFRQTSNEQITEYWKSSVTAAIVCREIAARQQWPDPDSEMVAGLLCDLGVLLLQETFPDPYAEIVARATSGLDVDRCAMERQLLGVDHPTAGAHCLARWRLADDLTDAIRYHHHPEQAPPSCAVRAHLLCFASQIARLHQTQERAALLGEIVLMAQQRYAMTGEQVFTFLESLQDKISEFAALIEVDLGPEDSFTNLFAKATENLSKLAVEASLDSLRVNEEKKQIEEGLKDARAALLLSKSICGKPRKWKRSGGWQAASLTISTTC